MSAALIPIFLAAAAVAAQPPLNIVGEGLMSNPVTSNAPGGKAGLRYAGPIVYTNEKPPIIYFPPPPKDAQPGLNPGGSLSFFGKSKSPKSIKYVPMPHHDLPVLIYTSDKAPPIHVVQPPPGDNSIPYHHHAPPPPPPPQSPSSFGPPRTEFDPLPGSLSSHYREIIPEATAPRVVTSSYEIPGTSYGTPMKAVFSGSLDLPSAVPSSGGSSSHLEPILPPAAEPIRPLGAPSKKPPHIMYSGHPPIHIFNEPDMYVKAPKEIPLKSFEELPPKASFGPPKSAFGPPSGNAFTIPHRHHYRRPFSASPFSLPSPSRPLYSPQIGDNLILSSSSNNPSSVLPPPSSPAFSHPPHSISTSSSPYLGGSGGSSPAGPPSYSFSPQHSMFSFGPFSVEYGPPSEPFMSFSEPTGSLSSFYGAAADGAPAATGSTSDDWIPGPPPKDLDGGHLRDNEWNSPPPHSPPAPPPPPPVFSGPTPMHSSVLLPSSHSHPHAPFGGSKLAHLFSSFKLKRPKPKHAIAPKSMHKPPIIIYYGKKPPMHVYQKPEMEETTNNAGVVAGSSPSISVTQAEPSRNEMRSVRGNEPFQSSGRQVNLENVDLTYGGSQNTEVRVAAPSQMAGVASPISSISSIMQEGKPAIIQAKPVDIFSSSELQPSIYMARNSLNTIYVSDLNGSGSKALKTFIVRRSEPSSHTSGQLAISEATVFPPVAHRQQDNNKNEPFFITSIAQDRISGDRILALSPQQEQQQQQPESTPLVEIPVSAAIPETPQVDLEQLSQQEENGEELKDNEPERVAPSTTILIAPVSPSHPDELKGSDDDKTGGQPAEARRVQVAIIQSPSTFQTSLSQAEKDAEQEASAAE